jgi:hypothetical protein
MWLSLRSLQKGPLEPWLVLSMALAPGDGCEVKVNTSKGMGPISL